MHENTGTSSLTVENDPDGLGNDPADLLTITREAIAARLWDARDAGVILGRLSRRHVYRLLASGELKGKHLGSRHLVVGQSLLDYMDNLPDSEAA